VPFSGSGTCSIAVQFNPASTGTKPANLTIPSNTTNTDSTINQRSIVQLSGTGFSYGITVAPGTLAFGMILLPDDNEAGNTPTGCTDNQNGTVSCRATITDTGSEALSNISLSTGNGPFTVNPAAIASLAAGANTGATVTYTATDGKTPVDTGTLTVYAGSYSASIVLTAVTNTRPNTPVNRSPADGTNVSLPVQLTASAFSDADGDTQKSSTWTISTDSQFATGFTVFISANDVNNLGAITVPSGILRQGVTYYWKVSYTDSRGASSMPSATTSFLTASMPMNQSGTTPLATTVTDSSGSEITSLSGLAPAIANGTASQQLLTDLGNSAVINSGNEFNPNSQSPTVAIVKENGGSGANGNNVLGVVTPAGTNIDTVTTTVPTDPSFNSAPPAGYAFPAGVVSFKITGVTGINNPVQVTFYPPAPLPANAVWYKYTPASGWLQINKNGTYDATGTAPISAATTFTVVNGKGVLTITDNDVTDLNPDNGVVLDPGGPAVPVAASTPAAGGSTGGNSCFIATAAFGSYLNPYVTILRSFRDTFLLTTRAGSAFVEWYYRVSPSIADKIRASESLKAGVRAALMPAVGFSALCLKVGLLPGVLLTALLLLITVTLVIAVTRKLRCGRYQRQ
jgi:hypothetical protein